MSRALPFFSLGVKKSVSDRYSFAVRYQIVHTMEVLLNVNRGTKNAACLNKPLVCQLCPDTIFRQLFCTILLLLRRAVGSAGAAKAAATPPNFPSRNTNTLRP